jgi:hypothetical protein
MLIALLIACSTNVVAAAEPEDAVTAGARALDSWWDYPWYDDQNDSVRRIELQPRPQPSTRVANSTGVSAPGSLGWLEVVGWILIGLLAVAILVMLWRGFQHRRAKTGSPKAGLIGTPSAIARLEELPFRVDASAGDLLSLARRAAERGDYSQAIVLLYSHLLLELDKHEAIRLTKGKTNRQYLRELGREPRLAALLALSMFAFEDVFFGGHALSQERFERCWHDAMQLLHESSARKAA